MSKTHLEEVQGPFTMGLYRGFAHVHYDKDDKVVHPEFILDLLNARHRSEIGEEDLEFCAHLEHERWARWQTYLHSCCIQDKDGSLRIPKEKVDHWEWLIRTPYAKLSERSKDEDRKQVREYAHLLRSQPTSPNTPSPEVIDALVFALVDCEFILKMFKSARATKQEKKMPFDWRVKEALDKAQSALALIDEKNNED